MTSLELLQIMGNTRDAYLVCAQEVRAGTPARIPKKRSRVLLIAAAVALCLLLVGCVAVYLGLQDLVQKETPFTEQAHFDKEGNWVEETELHRHYLSLQGFAETPGYQAQIQWQTFCQAYDPEGTLREASQGQWEPEESYYRLYGCYTQEMAQQLDQILLQYGLKPQGVQADFHSPDADLFLDAVSLPGLLKEDAQAELFYGYGQFFESGIFSAGLGLTLTGEGQWPHMVSCEFHFTYKDVFRQNSLVIEEMDTFDQWHYETADGTGLLLAMNQEEALILADREDAFLAIQMEAYHRQNVMNEPDFNRITYMTREDLQQLAEVFDYRIRPQVTDMAAARQAIAQREAARDAQEEAYLETYVDPNSFTSFSEYIRYLLARTEEPEQLYYLLTDLGGDGQQELLLGSAPDGSFGEVVRLSEGTLQISTLGFLEGLYLCEGDVIEWTDPLAGRSPGGVDAKSWFVQYFPDGTTQAVDWIILSYARDPENPWFTDTSGFGVTWGWEPISEEEYLAIRNRYVRLSPETQPITQFPLE